MSRRDICRQGLGWGGCALIGSMVGSADGQDATTQAAGALDAAGVRTRMEAAGGSRGWRIAAGLNGFMSSERMHKKHYPIWEVLDFCQKEGFEGVELTQGWPMGDYPPVADTRRVDALRGLYERYKLKIHTIQSAPAGRPFAEDAGERAEWVRTFREQARLARALGCAFVGTWPGGALGDQTIDRAIDRCAASYRQAAQICGDEGMWLSFEIEPPFVFNTLDHLKRILAGADHPACKTNYDPSHFDLMSDKSGRPEVMLEALGVEHIGHVHLTDTDGTLFEGTSRHVACGDGHCDMQASLKTLWDGGYRGWIMIDAWMIPDVYDACRKGKQAIERALASVTGKSKN
jgi:sugar phosphate isomerase/epimerase